MLLYTYIGKAGAENPAPKTPGPGPVPSHAAIYIGKAGADEPAPKTPGPVPSYAAIYIHAFRSHQKYAC
jgi:hypothetical protein